MGAGVKSSMQPAAQRTHSDASYPLDARAYKLLHEIGSGVSAVVYKAACLPLNSAVVAIKAIDLERSRANLDNVRRESKAMALLSHPNVLTAHCSFTVGSHLWVVMPFMAAGSLHSIISSSFPNGLPEPSISVVLRETLQALSYLHDQGHIHRDIKAGNILVDSDGSVKLADFGVSASIYESLASSSSSSSSSSCFSEMAGTPYWMAPEVIHPHVGYGIKADIWSFGITALELAHGRPPLSHLSPSKSLLMRVTSRLRIEDAAEDAEGKKKKFSKAFKEMVTACLSQDPSRRPSADKLLRHPFFKGSKPTDHLVSSVLHVVPSLEERFKGGGFDDSDEIYPPPSSSLVKSRRISGWNFNGDVFELDPISPAEETSKNGQGKPLGETGDPSAPPRLEVKESLVPSLVSLLGSLDFQRGMVMDVLATCGGADDQAEFAAEEKREQQLAGLVQSLEQTVQEMNDQLQMEMARNAELEEAVDRLRGKDDDPLS